MNKPKRFISNIDSHKVCKLNKSIHGLRQASCSWNLRFNKEVWNFGFIKNEDEPFVYKKVSGSKMIFSVLYVDDILLIGNDIGSLTTVKDMNLKHILHERLGKNYLYILKNLHLLG